jgi:GntR family transcriptional regulator/MocR family aminotransferase
MTALDEEQLLLDAAERPVGEHADEQLWWSLERRPGETLRVALERTLREGILSGALRGGVRLPASRKLAQELHVSRGVVTDAYDQLASQGFLIMRPRAAPVIAAVVPSRCKPARPHDLSREPRYDLSPTTPDVRLFPLTRWLASVQRAAREGGPAVLDYREHRGERALREVLADHLGRTRGVIVDPEQILITQGAAQSMDILLRVLRARHATRFAVEDPSHPTQHMRIRSIGLTLVAQPTDAEGLVVDGLAADAVLLTPAHQFPTGSVLSGQRRRALLRWARATNALVVEDDYDAEFRYDHEPVRALQGLAPDLVAQIGTVSKTLAPALRLGWLTSPQSLVDDAEREKRLVDDFSPVLDQLTLAAFLRSGDYDRHIRRARAVYRARRSRLLEALATNLPELAVAGIAAGVHLLLHLPAHVDDAAIAARAAELRLRVPALSSFYVGRPQARGLVVGYGRLHQSAITPAVRALTAVVRPLLDA